LHNLCSFAPRSYSLHDELAVWPSWIASKYDLQQTYTNGHVSMRAVDDFYELLGVGGAYVTKRRHSFFTGGGPFALLRGAACGHPRVSS